MDVSGFSLLIDPADMRYPVGMESDAEGGVHLRIPARAEFLHPIRMQWDAGHPPKTRLMIEVGSEAKVILVEELSAPPPPAPSIPRLRSGQAPGEGGSWMHECDVVVSEGANVEFISINRAGASIELKQQSHLSDNAKISWKNVTLSAGAVQHHLTSELTGADAESSIDWMFYAKGEEKYQLRARNIFTGRHGSGEITMKGVAEGKAHVGCNGMIEIGMGGAGTDTYLTQDVLMLDKTAKVDAVPGLEIKTNDVKASHSATVSRVTEEDLFYFGSRGIAEREARRMFVEGFLGEMVAKIGDGSVREEVLAAVEGKYGR